MMLSATNRKQIATHVTKVGIFWNLLLTGLKLIAGLLGKSSALIADAVHSLSDFVSDLVVLTGLHIASKPRDANHHYGHGKFETLTTIAITFTLFFAGGVMLYESGSKIFAIIDGRTFPRPRMITFWIALFSIAAKELLFQYTVRAGNKIKSQALITNAWHHRTDAFSSIAVTAGIAGSIFLGPKWRVLDPLAALLISGVIIHFAMGIFKTALDELTEASLEEDINTEILALAAGVPGAINPHDMKTRKIGNNYAIDMHVDVDPTLSIVEAHDIANAIEEQLREKYGEDTFLSIHIEPQAVNSEEA